MPGLKLAKDLVAGDLAMIPCDKPKGNQPVTIMAVVPSFQTIHRKVLILTLRRDDGTTEHRTYHENATIIVPSLKGV